jgi:hypothetical protein
MTKTDQIMINAGVPQTAIDRMPPELDGLVGWDDRQLRFVPLNAELLKAERVNATKEYNALRAQNAALLAAQKRFAARLTERIAELEAAQHKSATKAERLTINREIGLIQAIARDYTTEAL